MSLCQWLLWLSLLFKLSFLLQLYSIIENTGFFRLSGRLMMTINMKFIYRFNYNKIKSKAYLKIV